MLTDINNKLSMDSNYSLTVTPVDFNTPAIDQWFKLQINVFYMLEQTIHFWEVLYSEVPQFVNLSAKI